MSTRPDYIPEEYIDALEVLHDQVPPFPFTEVQSIIESEFGEEIYEIFSHFEKRPVASASLSQVHFAALKDGIKVAVKVQRPLIQEQIKDDLAVLSWLARVAGKFYGKLLRNINLEEAVREFKRYTIQELDFSLEAKTLDRFRENFKDWDDISFPEVYREYTSARVLTMERVSGLKLHEVKRKLSQEKRNKLNQRLIEMELKMFITDAFFHADLHPGNIFFQEDGGIAVIDVGMFGELSDEHRDRFLLYWLAVVEEEKERAFSHLIKLGKKTEDADLDGFYAEFSKTLDQFFASRVSERSFTKTWMSILTIGARYGFQFNSHLLLQAKALTTAEALTFVLMPDLKFNEVARPIITREIGERAKPKEIRRRLKQTFPEWLLVGELPDKSALFSAAEKNKSDRAWKEIANITAAELERHKNEDPEVVHGEYAVEIDENIERVFNFTTRFAQYALWHPTYTEKSKVIHVSGRYISLTPEVVGSIFRLDEIADGNTVLSNGEITEFERNRMWKWKAPLSFLPVIQIGTCFSYEDLGNNRTRLHEYFYYLDNPLMDFLASQRLLGSVEALKAHIEEELKGVKHLIESGYYEPEDMEYLWDDILKTTRVVNVDDIPKPVKLEGHVDYTYIK